MLDCITDLRTGVRVYVCRVSFRTIMKRKHKHSDVMGVCVGGGGEGEMYDVE